MQISLCYIITWLPVKPNHYFMWEWKVNYLNDCILILHISRKTQTNLKLHHRKESKWETENTWLHVLHPHLHSYTGAVHFIVVNQEFHIPVKLVSFSQGNLSSRPIDYCHGLLPEIRSEFRVAGFFHEDTISSTWKTIWKGVYTLPRVGKVDTVSLKAWPEKAREI